MRLKNAYIIKGEEVVKDEKGKVIEIICSYDPMSKSGSGTEESQRKVKEKRKRSQKTKTRETEGSQTRAKDEPEKTKEEPNRPLGETKEKAK